MKKKIIGSIIAAILVVGVVAACIWFKNIAVENEATVVKAGNGEKLVYATIDQIAGNDIEVTLLSDSEAERIQAMSKAAEQMTGNNRNEGNGGMPDMSGGGFPGGDFSGGMPDMSGREFPGGEMPEGGFEGEFSGGEMPEDFPEGMMPPGRPEESQTASYRIPVGTEVITTLGAITTFSHLEEGDTIAILMEESSEAILKIWMIM